MGVSFGKCFLFSINNLPTRFRKPITLGKNFFWGDGVMGEWGPFLVASSRDWGKNQKV
jgi:hypothetical protein